MKPTVLFAIFTIAVVLATPGYGQESSRDEFEEFCNAIKGRWVGKVTWVADWPGLGKKGEQVTCYWQGTVSQDGNVLIGQFVGGNGSGMGMTFYNAATKKIEGSDVDSGGSINRTVVYKQDGKWIMKGTGSLADGTPTENTSIGIISGNTWTWEGTGTVGDQATDQQHDVWTRMSDK